MTQGNAKRKILAAEFPGKLADDMVIIGAGRAHVRASGEEGKEDEEIARDDEQREQRNQGNVAHDELWRRFVSPGGCRGARDSVIQHG